MKYIRISVPVIVILVFGYIFLAEMILPFNSPRNGDICEMLPGDRWCLVKEDGTREPFLVPGRADGDIVLETVLPESIDKDVSVLCFRGMDMRVYIGDELRLDYSAKDYALFGDQSAEGYAMASVYPGDEGKKLTLYYDYNSGMVYDVYMGTRLGILADLFRQFGAELFLGLAVLLLGLISFIASCCYRIVHKKHLEMQELSLGVILGACWVMSNSVFRQLFTRNMSVISNVPFLMVMVMPLPFLVFVDSLQQRRYEKALMAVGILEIVDFCVCACLFVAGKMSLVQAFPFAAGCAIVSIIVLFGTIFLDVKKHLISSYRIIAVGFLFLAVAAVVQIMMYQFAHNGVFSGFFMAVGLFCFLICAIIYTIKQLIGIRIAANEAVHASKAKDDFLANMSHEIRTPLNGILGMDEMIIRDTGERRIKNYALEIKSAGNTLLSLINDILDLSKIEAGKLEILPVDYDVASVLNDVINITRNRALEKDLQYNFAVSEQLPSVLRGDEIRIRQVLLNIINNAIKYTREGRVDVEVSAEAGEIPEEIILVVKVADTGIGIREEDKDKLFMSFERLDEKKNRNIEGTGLGLHITYRLVEMMGGRIDVESKYGVGSTFTIVLPQPVVEREPIGDFSKAVTAYFEKMDVDETTLYAPDARVLIVDDNEMNLEVMEGLLRDTKMQLDLVNSGFACIEKAKENTYDCILLDQMMPKMNGETTLKELKSMGVTDRTPVIVLTADAIAGARENYLAKGFTDYLSKPVKYDRLEQVLKKYLPPEKQLIPDDGEKQLPVLLIWGSDSQRLREEKERLEGVYKCVCVVGSRAMERYTEKHEPDAVMHVE